MRTLHNLHKVEVASGELGVTVRNGDKWADALNEKIELCECDSYWLNDVKQDVHTVVGHAVVIEVWNGQFKDLPARYIENEHEISSRMYSGLLSSMRRAYGEKFAETNPVTVLVYKRYD